jgi:ankyrin repeat protein
MIYPLDLSRDKRGWTPLFYAASQGHLEMCEFLIEEGEANQHKLDKNKMTASTVAKKLGGTVVATIA